MKKALVMLLAFALVGGLFAAPDADLAPSVSGDATLSWGIKFGTDPANFMSGFLNTMNAAVKMPLVKKATVTKGEGETYGWIELKDFELGAQATSVTGSAPAITAKIVLATALEISVYSKPDVKISHIAAITDGDVALDPSYDLGGTQIKYSTAGQAFGVKLASGGDWNNNNPGAANQKYALGAFANLAFAPVKVNVDLGANFDAARTMAFGLDAPIAIAGVMKGLEVKPAFDATFDTDATANAFAWDAGLVTTLTMSDNNGDGNPAKTVLTIYYSGSDEDVEASLSFVEVEGGGLVANLDADCGVKLIDLIDSAANGGLYDAWVSGGYKVIINDTNNVYGWAKFSTTDALVAGAPDAANLLKLKVVFTNIAIAQTTITATYESEDLLVATGADPDLGKFVLAAKVAY